MSLVRWGGFAESLKAARGGPLSVTRDDPNLPSHVDRKEMLEVLTQHPAFCVPPKAPNLREASRAAPAQRELEEARRAQRQRAIWKARLEGCEPPNDASPQNAAAIRAGWIAQTPDAKTGWFFLKMLHPPIELIDDGTYEQFCEHKGNLGEQYEERLFMSFVQGLDLNSPPQLTMLRIFCSHYSQTQVVLYNAPNARIRNAQLALAIANLPGQTNRIDIYLHLEDPIYNQLAQKVTIQNFVLSAPQNPAQPAPRLDDVQRITQFPHVKMIYLNDCTPAMALAAFQCASLTSLGLKGRSEYRLPHELAGSLLTQIMLVDVSDNTARDALQFPKILKLSLREQHNVDSHSDFLKNCRRLDELRFEDTDAGNVTAASCALLPNLQVIHLLGEHGVTPEGLRKILEASALKKCVFRVKNGLTGQHVLQMAADRALIRTSATLFLQMTDTERNSPENGFNNALLRQLNQPESALKLSYIIIFQPAQPAP